MSTVTTAIELVLNGLSLGFVYVLLAAGLSIIFGVMHIINFSHGELLALGAYFAVAITGALAGAFGFVAALVVAPVLVGILGVAMERYTLQPIYDRNPIYQILLTFGVVLIINDLIIAAWGPVPQQLAIPAVLEGPVTAFGITYSRYNLFMIGCGAVLAASGWALLRYTRTGLIVRAGAQDREKVRYFGIDIDRYYALIFGFGAILAGVAGVIFGGYRSIDPTMGMSVIVLAFVVVVIGGLGSYKGAIVVGLGLGVVQTIVQTYVPALDGIIAFLVLIGVLLVRPEGLYGTDLHETSDESLLKTYDGVLTGETRLKLAVGLFGLLLLLPWGVGVLYTEHVATVAIEILIWGLFALSMDFLLGYTGMVSLGHALFFGLGAYTTVLVVLEVSRYAVVAMAIVVVLSAVTAWIVGYLSIRVSGIYFALITLGFAELFYNAVLTLEVTGGSNGLFGATPLYGVPGFAVDLSEVAFGVGPVRLSGELAFFYLALFLVLGCYLLFRRILKSPFGRVLQAIRENEQRVTFTGYDTRSYKRRSFVISGTIAGVSGALFGLHWGLVAPSVAHWINSGEVLIMVILGGIGTLHGAVVGAGFFIAIEELLSEYFEQSRMLLGILFVLFVIYVPGGAVSMPAALQSKLDGLRGHRTGGAGAEDFKPAEEEDARQ